ncbi:Eco57I restriction-modification methylase domain-containing protein [Salana multivorans]
MEIPAEVFEAEDALGWVYQFWQTAEKKRVNASGNKIGGADLSPVTQLFTENYMVRFLLENSLGAWWAARHPDSPLVDGWEYLRRLDDGTPAAGTFPEWPTTAAEVTVMDPCCGSGHFLVAMFGMLWRMRAEEEGLSPREAQDAVLRDNLFGLELDPRCTQIATFNVALEAWKQGGYREIPLPQIACSGVPVRQSLEEWLDGVPEHLRDTMSRLHFQFRHADTLGSLIDPRPANADERGDALFGRDMSISVTWDELQPHLAAKFAQEGAAGSVLDHVIEDVVQAAKLLADRYTLVATNPPYLKRGSQQPTLADYCEAHHFSARSDLATSILDRCITMTALGGTTVAVTPSNWLGQAYYQAFRDQVLSACIIIAIATLGPRAFTAITGEIVNPTLVLVTASTPSRNGRYFALDATNATSAQAKSVAIRADAEQSIEQSAVRRLNGSAIVTSASATEGDELSRYATSSIGLHMADNSRFRRGFWEVHPRSTAWRRILTTVERTQDFSGRDGVAFWPEGGRIHEDNPAARIQGRAAWNKEGVLVSLMGELRVTRYTGELFDNNTAALVPANPSDLAALWSYASSDQFNDDVRTIDRSLKVTNMSLTRVRVDWQSWKARADESGPLPEPHSDDPTQWLFKGDVATSTEPLQVAVARLLGHRWPDQEPDDLDRFADADGIVTVPNLGEGDAATRLRELLAAAYGDRWSGALEHSLVTDAGGKTGRLEDWLRDTFFAHHCKVFDNRPFLWHVWDGRKDGFSAILRYHRLDRPTLEKLTYTSLGAWIRRQEHEVDAGAAGAEARLAAAQQLQQNLELIIEGEAPYDVYVRWKPMHEQPIGWAPDLDDGVRLNIRPFVTAGILRSKVNVHWKTDRGKNPDGSERVNDLHPTLTERRTARAQHEAGSA